MFSDARNQLSMPGVVPAGPACTFSTKNFEVTFRQINRGNAPAIITVNGVATPLYKQDAAGAAVDDALLLCARDAVRDLAAEREAERLLDLECNRSRQARFFAAFQRPVPDGAHAEPLVRYDYQKRCSLVSGKHGFRIVYFGLEKLRFDTLTPVRVLVDGDTVACDESLVAPWLRDLMHTFGGEMVFRTFGHGTPSCFDAIFAKYNVPPAATAIHKNLLQSPVFACTLQIDGTTVTVYPDRFDAPAQPEKLTPWSRALLARADAHAILLEMVNVL